MGPSLVDAEIAKQWESSVDAFASIAKQCLETVASSSAPPMTSPTLQGAQIEPSPGDARKRGSTIAMCKARLQAFLYASAEAANKFASLGEDGAAAEQHLITLQASHKHAALVLADNTPAAQPQTQGGEEGLGAAVDQRNGNSYRAKTLDAVAAGFAHPGQTTSASGDVRAGAEAEVNEAANAAPLPPTRWWQEPSALMALQGILGELNVHYLSHRYLH